MKSDNDIQTVFNPHTSGTGPSTSAASKEHGNTRSSELQCANIESGNVPAGENPPLYKKESCCEKTKKVSKACCSSSAKKIYNGVCVTVFTTISWVATTHCMKHLYHPFVLMPYINATNIHYEQLPFYNAPFFTTWFCTNWLVLFFPIYYIGQLLSANSSSAPEIVCESIRNFRGCYYTLGQFLVRCVIFCILWVLTNYIYIYSLRALLCTDTIALYATTVSFVYLLSWVMLHQQFVGLRIVAIIFCNTGVAFFTYMDGIAKSPTLSSVLLATGAATGSAVYKVVFRRLFGDVTYGQTALFLSFVGLLNAILLWPACLVLYFTGSEVLRWERLPWPTLLAASTLFLVNNLLMTFSGAVTYELFVQLSLITSVPVSAALDMILYGAHFFGMRLTGIILISIGFFLVMFPSNWPDYITRLLRWNRKDGMEETTEQKPDVDYRTGYIRSHLRSPSGRVR